MRLRDLRLTILTGLAGILHSTAQALLRQAQRMHDATESQAGPPRLGSGPPQHWLERVKEARVWYGTAPRLPAGRRPNPHQEQANATGATRQDSRPSTEKPTFKEVAIKSDPANFSNSPEAGLPREPADKEHRSSPPDSAAQTSLEAARRIQSRRKAGFRLHPPAAGNPDQANHQKQAARGRSSGANASMSPPAGQSQRKPNPAEREPIPPQLDAVLHSKSAQETFAVPNNPRMQLHIQAPAPAFPRAPAQPPESLRQSEEPTSATAQAPRLIHDQTRSPLSRQPLVQMEEPLPRKLAPGNEPGMAPDKNTLHRAEQITSATLPASEDFPTNNPSRWLELPPDPTILGDLDAQQEAWAGEAREQRHEEKLAREQRGDLWSG